MNRFVSYNHQSLPQAQTLQTLSVGQLLMDQRQQSARAQYLRVTSQSGPVARVQLDPLLHWSRVDPSNHKHTPSIQSFLLETSSLTV